MFIKYFSVGVGDFCGIHYLPDKGLTADRDHYV